MLLLIVSLSPMLLVYRENKEAFITGVGWCSKKDTSWVASRHPFLRWDSEPAFNEQVKVSIMPNSAVKGAYGFLLHEACRKILHKASEPTGLSLERLVSVCEALPSPSQQSGVEWGHDYGGLLGHTYGGPLNHTGSGHYPWLEPIRDLTIEKILDVGAFHDPFNGIDLPTVFSAPVPHYVEESSYLKKCTDCFGKLPLELRELIAVHLPTKSALNLRKASRSFLDLFSSSVFWSSRFELGGEKDFIFEARETKKVKTTNDLISFYRFSKCFADSPSLLNRKRIWILARRLAVITDPSYSNHISVERESLPDYAGWIRLSGKEQPSLPQDEWRTFDLGCRSIITTELDIPNGPLKIGITTVNMGDWDYVTGLRFSESNGDEQIVGYRSTKHETVCSVAVLQGFKVAMGPGGVRALQVIGCEDQVSRWVGRINGIPLSERLISDEPISTLSVSLDSYKITALAIRTEQSKRGYSTPPLISNLRHSALWFPEIPPSDGLLLNEDSFVGLNPFATNYQTLSWIRFGGETGKALDHVQGILVQYFHGLRGLQFVYDEVGPGNCSEKLGRCHESELQPEPIFRIDGPGGERIDSISVSMNSSFATYFFQHGPLSYVKISTNHGRVLHIGNKDDDFNMLSLNIAQGTTITGFYGHWNIFHGFVSLGVISEHIIASL